MSIKKGDKVIVITGGNKGKKGKVQTVLRQEGKVVIEGVNMKKKHVKATRNSKGSVIEKAFPIHISNVKIEK